MIGVMGKLLDKKPRTMFGVEGRQKRWITGKVFWGRIQEAHPELLHSYYAVKPHLPRLARKVGLECKTYGTRGGNKLILFRPPRNFEIRRIAAQVPGVPFVKPVWLEREDYTLASISHLVNSARAHAEAIRVKGLGRERHQNETPISAGALIEEVLDRQDYPSPATEARPKLVRWQLEKALFKLHKDTRSQGSRGISGRDAIIYLILRGEDGLKPEEIASHFKMSRQNVDRIMGKVERHIPEGYHFPKIDEVGPGRMRARENEHQKG